MFAPNRLRKTEEFERARKAGRSWGHPLVALQAVQVGGELTRCGFVTSKRVGNAVQRNRVRRCLREVVRQLLPRLAPGTDLVFVARPAAAQADLAALREAVTQLLSRARLLDRDVTTETRDGQA